LQSRRQSINQFEAVSKFIYHSIAVALLVSLAGTRGADSPAKFLGAQSCASSGCHGGGGTKQNQFLTWSLKDFHSQRPTSTLTTARSKQIAEALAIKDPTANTRCASCHAPLNEVPENLHGENFKVSEGVSCESCHGSAENWLRSHTRVDYTRADRTAAGMRDLRNLYVRANTCVACHQNVDGDILNAGHPELIFELDGQSVAEPKHWQEATNWNGAKAWFVGQAVALREMTWQLSLEKSPTENQINRWKGLVWVMSKSSDEEHEGKIDSTSVPKPENLKSFLSEFDYYASFYSISETADEKERWHLIAQQTLARLANTKDDFKDSSVPQPLQARRAERLVLALDRHFAALPELKNNEPVQAALNKLFKLAQSIPDFDPKEFAAALEKFAAALPPP
jgi:hypothetical protein